MRLTPKRHEFLTRFTRSGGCSTLGIMAGGGTERTWLREFVELGWIVLETNRLFDTANSRGIAQIGKITEAGLNALRQES